MVHFVPHKDDLFCYVQFHEIFSPLIGSADSCSFFLAIFFLPFFQFTIFTFDFMWIIKLRAWAGLHVCAQVCMGMRWCARVCAGVRGCAWVYVGVHGCTLVWVGVRGFVHRCAQLYIHWGLLQNPALCTNWGLLIYYGLNWQFTILSLHRQL